ncbi:MAG: EAL domain-containing protein [Burkholderiales bacterium]|nr:EAL domain-containing protein [Burkholderiales bacterium]
MDISLPLRTAAVVDGTVGADEALAEFAIPGHGRRLRAGQLTRADHWLFIKLPATGDVNLHRMNIEALRIRDGVFWLAQIDGESPRLIQPIPWWPTRDGVAIDWPAQTTGSLAVLGFVRPESFNRPRAVLASPPALEAAQYRFERNGGFLLGGMLMLAGFSFLVAGFTRDQLFLLFGAWLLTSLRVAGQNGGWDLDWLGIELGYEAQRTVLRLTLIAHFLVSIGLFTTLFRHELQALRLRAPMRALLLFVLAITLPAWLLSAANALLVAWGCGVLTIVAISYSLYKVLRRFPGTIAYAYTLAWGIACAGLFGTMAYASGLFNTPPIFFNSQISAIASALIMAIALAEHVRSERRMRIFAQHSADDALKRLRENYEQMPVGMFSMRPDGLIIEYNPAFGAMFGLQPPSRYDGNAGWLQVIGRPDSELLAHKNVGDVTESEFTISDHEGRRRWLHVRGMHKANRIEAWVEDITARKESESRLQYLADHDTLTGLLNRRGFAKYLERAIAASRNVPACFAYVDLDRFKLVNDLFGHAAGDQILLQLTTRMREIIKPPHVPARVGGDEFVVILNGLDLRTATELCEKLRQQLGDLPYQYQDKAFSVAASIGLIRVQPGMTPGDAMTASDRACAEAKSVGGANVVAFDSSSTELTDYLDEIKLVAGMRERLPVENFFTLLQPIVSLSQPAGNLSYEVLIRMRDPHTGKVVPPGRFIGAAERNGMMSQIDRWVLRSTLEWLDDNPDHRDALGFCTVNLSGASLNDEKFLQDTIAYIREHRDAAERICFEITESVALYDLNTTRRFVDKIKSFGARLALDDFGAGYTSFSYLKELPGDIVKIDGSFIRDINLNPANYAITRAIVDLSRQIGMACIAEWVENSDIVRSLIDLKVDYAQGYALARPLERERLLTVRNGLALVQDPAVAALLTPHAALPLPAPARPVRIP